MGLRQEIKSHPLLRYSSRLLSGSVASKSPALAALQRFCWELLKSTGRPALVCWKFILERSLHLWCTWGMTFRSPIVILSNFFYVNCFETKMEDMDSSGNLLCDLGLFQIQLVMENGAWKCGIEPSCEEVATCHLLCLTGPLGDFLRWGLYCTTLWKQNTMQEEYSCQKSWERHINGLIKTEEDFSAPKRLWSAYLSTNRLKEKLRFFAFFFPLPLACRHWQNQRFHLCRNSCASAHSHNQST